jgi:hypothetical protein
MTHFESVLSLNTTEQGSFKIQGQIEAARLHIQHPIINEAVEIVSQLDGLIDRRKLIEIEVDEFSHKPIIQGIKKGMKKAKEYTKHCFWLNNTYVRDEIYLK